jgi:hypothetical protein
LKSVEVVEEAGDAGNRELELVRIGGAVSFSNITYSYLFVNSDLRRRGAVAIFEKGGALFELQVSGETGGGGQSCRGWWSLSGAGFRDHGERRQLGSEKVRGREPQLVVVGRYGKALSQRVVLEMDVVELKPMADGIFGRFLICAGQTHGEDGRDRTQTSFYIFEES